MSQTSTGVEARRPQPERRKTPRCRVLKPGKIITIDKRSIFDCTIRNQSLSGAWLEAPSHIGIPDEFYFLLAGQAKLVHSSVVRRTATGFAVRFLHPGRRESSARRAGAGCTEADDMIEQLSGRIIAGLNALDCGDVEAARGILLGYLTHKSPPTVS